MPSTRIFQSCFLKIFKCTWDVQFLTYLEACRIVLKNVSYKIYTNLAPKHHFLCFKNAAKNRLYLPIQYENGGVCKAFCRKEHQFTMSKYVRGIQSGEFKSKAFENWQFTIWQNILSIFFFLLISDLKKQAPHSCYNKVE